MTEYLLLPKLKLKLFIKFFMTLPRAKTLVGLAFLLIAIIFIGGEYLLFYAEFTFLKYQPIIGKPLTIHILNLAFLAFFTMLLLSNIVSAIPTLYRSKEVEYLLTTPLKHFATFVGKFIDNATYSSWASFILIPPVFVALGVAYRAGWFYYPLGLFIVFPFIFIAASLGIFLIVLIARYLLKYGFKRMALILAPIILILTIFGLKRAVPEETVVLRVTSLAALNRYLAGLDTSSPYLPSTWVIESLKTLIEGNFKDSLFFFLLISSTALATIQVCFLLARRSYFDSWSIAQSLGGNIKPPKRGKIEIPDSRILKGQIGSLIRKDIKVFFRDASEWSQAIFLLLLIIIYIISLGRVPVLSYPTSSFWATIITFTNFGVTGYILTTFALRFIFPTISLEGRSAWILYSAPMKIKKIFLEKFLLGFFSLLILSESLIIFSSLALHLNKVIIISFALCIALLVLSIVSLTLGLGAVFPDFRDPNPSSLSTSFGGIFTLLLCLGHVAAVVILIAMPLQSFFKYTLDNIPVKQTSLIQAGVGILVLTFTTTLIPIFLGFKNIENYDF